MRKLLTSFFIITLGFNSTSTQAKVIDTPYTTERLIFSIKINADGTSEKVQELTTLYNTQQAASGYAYDEISYSAEDVSVKVTEAYTILPDGKRIAVAKNNIHVKDAKNNGATSINDTKVLTIIYPNVVVGSKNHYKAINLESKSQKFTDINFMKKIRDDIDLYVQYDTFDCDGIKKLT